MDNSFCLAPITKEDKEKIIGIFAEYDAIVYNLDDAESLDYFVVGLDDETDDCFYDHSEAFDKIFNELNCVCTGFQYNNDYYTKGQINNHYGIWFSKIQGGDSVS